MKTRLHSFLPACILLALSLPLTATDFPTVTITPTSGNTSTLDLRYSGTPSAPGLTLNYNGNGLPSAWFEGNSNAIDWLWKNSDYTMMSLDHENNLWVMDSNGQPAVGLSVGYSIDTPTGIDMVDKYTGRGSISLKSGVGDYGYIPSLTLNDPIATTLSFGHYYPKPAIIISAGHSGYSTDYPPYYDPSIALWDRTSNSDNPAINIDAGTYGAGVAPSITIAGSPVITQNAGDTRYLRVLQTQFQLGTGSLSQSTFAFAFGDRVRANGLGAVAMGASHYSGLTLVEETAAVGQGATAFGYGSKSDGNGATAIGSSNIANGSAAIAVGSVNIADGSNAIAIGSNNQIVGGAGAVGAGNYVLQGSSYAFGSGNSVGGAESAIIGNYNSAGGDLSFVAGITNTGDGGNSVAVGIINSASGLGAVAVGYGNTSVGQIAHSIGYSNIVSADAAVALGASNIITSYSGFAAGISNMVNSASGFAMAFGYGNTSGGAASFTAGYSNSATGDRAVAIGSFSLASGYAATALGGGVKALQPLQTVLGAYNDPLVDTDALFVIGNGIEITPGQPATAVRSNAFVVRRNGDTDAAGNLNSKKATGYNKFKAPILVPESGDISMGEFTAGEEP
jgi:autotransporter adhesin